MAWKKTDDAPSYSRRAQNSLIDFTRIYVAIFVILTIAYLVETILPKPDKAILTHYHLSHASYYWLIDPLAIVLVLIWLVSLYGSLRVKAYARVIDGSKDGKGMNLIGNGLLTQTISLPIISNLSYILNHTAKNHPGLQPTATIIINYISLGLMAAAFILVFAGGQKLFKLVPSRTRQLPRIVWQGVFILASSLYTYLVIIQPIHHPLDRRAYFLPDWLLVLTIAAPYIFFWYLGVNGAYNMYLFSRNIKGSIYKDALSFLASGVALVVLASVITRIITSLSSRITSLKITPILLIVYGLLAVIAAGYILIAIGAKKLRKIEEA